MGDLNVFEIKSKKDRANYIYHLLNDIKALDLIIERGLIEEGPLRIGAEQEFCLVNDHFLPENKSLEILDDINDDHFTTEISNYNLEINLDAHNLGGDCFSKMHKQLELLLDKAKKSASKKGAKIILTGILPSLTVKNADEQNMTELERYAVLNDAIKGHRRQNFDIHIKGVDELNLLHDSVMLEGCNTSFQMHLQLGSKDFVDNYNWAQAISGPILSACTNSPLLFGKELWSETRIALFTQSVDTRANSFLLNEKQSRVSFGTKWLTGPLTDIFKDNISRFRSFLTTAYIKDSIEMLNNGEMPKLRALGLHSGTVYPWNRVCYGVIDGKPNLRIENRYIPSGPTVKDEIANMMFWVGVMLGKPKKYNNIHEQWDFKDVKTNFFNAARYGMATQFYWNGEYVSSFDLIVNELLPMAYKGLYKVGVSPQDAEYYLKIIKNRVHNNNGSEWLTRNYRRLLKTHKPYEAMQVLTASLYDKQEKGYPVSTWGMLHHSTESRFKGLRVVKHIMSSDIFSVDKKDSVELVLNIMKWKNIHHMPVINGDRELIGLLSWTDLKDYLDDPKKLDKSVKTIMKTDIVTIDEYTPVDEAKALMEKHGIGSLPVVNQNKLIGLITLTDF
ncbi:CBS domain-containing protein [Seonamhaeicola maritimus]|uniref:CBS domain-containing protein n=1 Tax=Seonamhaeicola maritimus TaxID=2591822 RepID=A0A5C7GHF8_9FLAO|nr:CBS domain-containing protein [Seonamhaeicola maritimus]TXG37210.1 CBS domain-containing protein [Seonamhaeicola maritimus]